MKTITGATTASSICKAIRDLYERFCIAFGLALHIVAWNKKNTRKPNWELEPQTYLVLTKMKAFRSETVVDLLGVIMCHNLAQFRTFLI